MDTQTKKLDISKVISAGWNLFKGNMGMAILGWVIAVVAMSLFNLLAISVDFLSIIFHKTRDREGIYIIFIILQMLSILLRLISMLVAMWVTGGMMLFFTKMARGYKALISNLFIFDRRVLSLIVSQLLISIGVLLGLICCIIPGIILALMWSQTLYFIVDHHMGPVEAMKASANVMKGNKLNYFFLGLLVGIIILVVTLFTCGIGLFFAAPWGCLVLAMAYVFLSPGEDTMPEGTIVPSV